MKSFNSMNSSIILQIKRFPLLQNFLIIWLSAKTDQFRHNHKIKNIFKSSVSKSPEFKIRLFSKTRVFSVL